MRKLILGILSSISYSSKYKHWEQLCTRIKEIHLEICNVISTYAFVKERDNGELAVIIYTRCEETLCGELILTAFYLIKREPDPYKYVFLFHKARAEDEYSLKVYEIHDGVIDEMNKIPKKILLNNEKVHN
jgi:hypothetical protein